MGKTSARPESKSNRKFDKKLEFYSKVKDAVASLSAQKSITKKNSKQQRRQKKLKAYDFSSLSELLPDPKLNASRKPGPEVPFKLNCKSRKGLILKEANQLSAVLKHPLFQSDPLSAIHQHLQSTQPIIEEPPPKKKVNKNGSKKRKSKASNRVQPMDM